MNKYYMPVVVVSIRGCKALGSHEASVKTFMKSVLSVWGQTVQIFVFLTHFLNL